MFYPKPAYDTATNTEWQLPEAVLIQYVSPDDELVGSKTPNQHTTLPRTRSDNYQKLYWYNLFLLMMSMKCLKQAENY